MTKPPTMTEWDISNLSPERRAYLEKGWSFEEIAWRAIGTAQHVSNRIEPYRTAPPGEEDGRQIILIVRVEPETCDLLYNAPDGLRGRYWQSPDHGFKATKHLIAGLQPRLMSFVEEVPPTLPEGVAPMTSDDVRAS